MGQLAERRCLSGVKALRAQPCRPAKGRQGLSAQLVLLQVSVKGAVLKARPRKLTMDQAEVSPIFTHLKVGQLALD